jgi:hypothetical protein
MDVYLRIVGGFKPGKIVPEKSAAYYQNREHDKKYPTLVRALCRVSRSQWVIRAGILCREISL